MVPDFVNKFASRKKDSAVEEEQPSEVTDAEAKKAAGKEMEELLQESVNEEAKEK